MIRQVWFILLIIVAGCNHGPEIAPVSGRVTLDGKSLGLAEVTFEPREGRASHARTDGDGRYDLQYTREKKGALVGSHMVRIRSVTEVTLPNGLSAIRPQLVPPRYNTESELRREVESRTKNEFDFDLSTKAK